MLLTSSGLPFEIRGTAAWDLREHRRRMRGNRCISLGAIPFSEITRIAPIQRARILPTAERLAELLRNQEQRHKHG